MKSILQSPPGILAGVQQSEERNTAAAAKTIFPHPLLDDDGDCIVYNAIRISMELSKHVILHIIQ